MLMMREGIVYYPRHSVLKFTQMSNNAFIHYYANIRVAYMIGFKHRVYRNPFWLMAAV